MFYTNWIFTCASENSRGTEQVQVPHIIPRLLFAGNLMRWLCLNVLNYFVCLVCNSVVAIFKIESNLYNRTAIVICQV